MRAVKKCESTKEPTIALAKVVRLIMQTCTSADADLIRETLGTASVPSIPQLAKVIGVKESTVRNTYRRDGMPGTVKRGPGQRSSFRLADVVIWLLRRGEHASDGRRQATNSHQRTDAAREELNAIELESARLVLDIRRAKAAELIGDVVSVAKMTSEVNMLFGVASNGIMGIPRKARAILPAKLSGLGDELERLFRVELQTLSELSLDDVRRMHANGNGKAH